MIHGLLDLPAKQDESENTCTVKRWVSRVDDLAWLLIFDGTDNLEASRI
jgi:hypothetical protein